MHYIVLDLEWNQSSELERSDKLMPFEIIEIGAVKLNLDFEVEDKFSCIIKPVVYPVLHNIVKDMLGYDEGYLVDGGTFKDSAMDFMTWCGQDYIFCTWGDTDLIQLQRNFDYYGLPKFQRPLKYYNIQKIFAYIHKDADMKSLQTAVIQMGIPQDREFHHALVDAEYTASILQLMDKKLLVKNSSVDYYNNPKSRSEEVRKYYENSSEYITREFASKHQALEDKEVHSYGCCLCCAPPLRKIRWFSSSNTVYYSIVKCREHGFILGKIKLKTTIEGKIFVVKTLTCVDSMEAKGIKDRYDEIKIRKRERRKRLRHKA